MNSRSIRADGCRVHPGDEQGIIGCGQRDEGVIDRLSDDAICSLVYAYQDELVAPDRKRLLVRFLEEKANILKRLVMENENA